MRKNALWNCKNPYQGSMNRVLCVCSAGLLRSPTIAWVLSNHDYNTRAVGIHDYALIPIDEVLIEWADQIVCADKDIQDHLITTYKLENTINLGIPDSYGFRDPDLVNIIETKLKEIEMI